MCVLLHTDIIMVILVRGMKLMPQILISLQKGIKHNMLQTLITTEKNMMQLTNQR